MEESPGTGYIDGVKNMLVIGMGFLGTAAANLAERKGWTVSRASKTPDHENIQPADLGNRESLSLLKGKIPPPEIILFTASTAHGGADVYQTVFANGVHNLVSVFPEARLILCSSTSVYERTDGATVTESSPAKPERETSRILLEAEQTVLENGGTVARLANLYGPGRSVLLARVLDGSAVIEGDKNKWVNHIHRDDAASALLLLAEAKQSRGEIYNVSDDMPLAQKKLYRALAALMDKPYPPSAKLSENRKRAWTNKAVSNSKLRDLGWEPYYPTFLEAVPDLAPTMPGYEVRVDEEEEND